MFAVSLYVTTCPDVMYTNQNYEHKVRITITNIFYTKTLFFKHYFCKIVWLC